MMRLTVRTALPVIGALLGLLALVIGLGRVLPTRGVLAYWADLNQHAANLRSLDLDRGMVITHYTIRMDSYEDPALSPDSRYLVYASGGDLRLRDQDTGSTRALTFTPDFGEFEPQWSPDGRLILFTGYTGTDYDLQLIDPRRRAPRTLLTLAGDQTNAVWSPDGTRIAFRHSLNGVQGVWLVQADGSNAHPVASVVQPGNFVWSPDGAMLVYSGLASTNQYAIYFLDLTRPGALPQRYTGDPYALFPEAWTDYPFNAR